MEAKFDFKEGHEVGKIVNAILDDYKKGRTIDEMEDFFDQPDKDVIIDIVEKLMKVS
jgi:serine O-acetyltransferase